MFINHPLVLNWAFVGSRITCDPAPTNTDNDVLVLCKQSFLWKKNKYIEELLEDGFVKESGSYAAWMHFNKGKPICAPTSNFISMRKDELNLIVTTDEKFYRRFMAATQIAKGLNLLKKQDRISLFQGILYDHFDHFGHNWWENET